MGRRLADAVGQHWIHLVRGSGFIFACRAGGAVLALLTQWVLARWLGAEHLGSYLLAYSWLIIVARLSGLGLNSAAPRFIGKGIALNDAPAIRGFVGFNSKVALAVSGTATVIGAAASFLLIGRSGQDPWPLVIAFVAVPFMAVNGVLQSFALSFSWFRAAFIPNTVLRPALFLGVVSFLWILGGTMGVSGVMLIQLASMAAALVVLLAAVGPDLKRDLTGVVPRVEAGPWTKTALALLVISLFRDYLPELSIIVADLYLSPEEIAIFSIAFKVAALISFVLFAVDSFALPQVAQAAALDDRASLQSFSERATRLTFIASLGAFVGFWLMGRWALSLFGPEFVDGYRLLLMISAAQVVRASVGPVLPLLTVGGHERESLKVFAAALVLVAPFVMLLAPTWGAEGVGAAVAGVMILSSLALSHRVRHLMGVDPSIISVLRPRRPTSGRD